ncbi:metal-dependent hydrolase [Natronococcus pandeyae]|uniref:Metal-dependent hydrolase n=1 Tax=Natronococcus pandeyae TaxID=2055836 RepID=A0A8J8Q3W1_9EURY|nr:metal-dependent hydrolase [Natronococcus pandeyae]TYL37244.1 metal-dependent hydrolase [Natronococcus pandeyae]
MAELLTHVLAAYILATLLSWRYEWLTPQFVTVAMIGAMIPDLSRLDLLIPTDLITAVFGIPFDWGAFHVLGGSLLAVAIGTVLAPADIRRRVGALLFLGMASHHALDLLLLNVSGYSYAVLWPLTGYHPPSPDLYLSTDRWPALCSAVLAAAVWYARDQR